jgi:hypothetical protein
MSRTGHICYRFDTLHNGLTKFVAPKLKMMYQRMNYRTRAIISRGLYVFTPFFTAVYNQERLTLETIYVVNKETFQIKSGL